MAVHATSDGWVVVTPLSHWSVERDAPPPLRLHLAPDDVQAWTNAVHDLRARAADSTTSVEGMPLPTLEPPSVCASEEDGIDCARLYGRAP